MFVTTLDDGETVVGYYALAAAEVAPEEAVTNDMPPADLKMLCAEDRTSLGVLRLR